MSLIDQLEATPEILRLLMGNVPDDIARRQPAPGRPSIAEVLDQLSWTEGHIYRARLDDPNAKRPDAPEFDGADPEESFAHWEEQREEAIEQLRADAATEELSEALLREWLRHDLTCVIRIAELVRDLMFDRMEHA